MSPASGPYEHDEDGYIDDPDFTGTRGRIIHHYKRVWPVYEALGTVGPYSTTGFIGNHNWYCYDGDWRRAKTFGDDADEILDDAQADCRSMYAVTSWKDTDAILSGATRQGDSFASGEGLAGYDDMRACAVWIDCDLNDKKRRGAFTDDERAAIEAEISDLLDVVADMYGMAPEDIAAFDSGGGIYPWGPAAATLPIVEKIGEEHDDSVILDGEEYRTTVGFVFDELTDRIKDHLDANVETEYISLDAATNKNRQSKAPLAIHSSHDILVTPLRDDSGEIDYTPTLVSDIDDGVFRRTMAEVNRITTITDKTREAVGPLITTLWPDYTGEWDQRLARWLMDERDGAMDAIHSRARAKKHRRDRVARRDDDNTPIQISAPGESDITPHKQDVYADLNRLTLERVAEKTIVDQWTDQATGLEDNSASGNRAFVPTWGNATSGTANIITAKCWQDTGEGGYGGPVVMALIDLDEMDPEYASPKRATGELWARGVEHLRDLGFSVRRWIPEAGSDHANGTYDRTPEWAMRELAYAEGHDPEDDVWRNAVTGSIVAETEAEAEQFVGDTGVEVQRSMRRIMFNAIVELLDAEGIDHQRRKR